MVQALRSIGKGEEATSDYGEGYWTMMNRNGDWCGRGTEQCKYDEEAEKERTSKAMKKKAATKDKNKAAMKVRAKG